MKDFFKDDNFNLLRKKMGIEQNTYAKINSIEVNEYGVKLEPIKIEKLRKGEDIDISIDQLDFTDVDPILRVGNINVVLYIRDQFYPTKYDYKYHISWCETLEQRKIDKKIDRYVITRKSDENFNVNLIDLKTHLYLKENEISKMKVCRGCLKKLNYEGYKDAKKDKSKKDIIYKSFSLEKFLENNNSTDSNRFENLNLYSDFTQPLNNYPSNWAELSKSYRQKVKWKCEKCGMNCNNIRAYLHVHHINSRKDDIRSENLIALCKKCHDAEHIKFNM